MDMLRWRGDGARHKQCCENISETSTVYDIVRSHLFGVRKYAPRSVAHSILTFLLLVASLLRRYDLNN